jgi:hypothetical protein
MGSQPLHETTATAELRTWAMRGGGRPGNTLGARLRRAWNWCRGKRIVVTDPGRGRVMVRTGRNSASRSNGGQWYLQRYEVANGLPPLPVCCRGRLADPVITFCVERHTGKELAAVRRWYEAKHGRLHDGQDLVLACVYEPSRASPELRLMHYRPTEVFEAEHPWLSSEYRGPSFVGYFGTWYGSGLVEEDHSMDFEVFYEVHPGWTPLPRLGASWR